jgi:DNA modification methylase
MQYEPVVYQADCEQLLQDRELLDEVDLSFFDPPFNQGKDYDRHDDNLPPAEYWDWMTRILKLDFDVTSEGGSIYFMQREKNTSFVLKALLDSGWTLQNLIVWKKRTSAIPQSLRFGKQYQVIAFATKGEQPQVFNRLRIDAPLESNQKIRRDDGIYITDVWDDIRELTSGYFAGNEAILNSNNERAHNQQSPIALLLRIILSSTNVGDTILDPFAGTGTTSIVARQLHRNSIAIENSKDNFDLIQKRLVLRRKSDRINKHYQYYRYTKDLNSIWPLTLTNQQGKISIKSSLDEIFKGE